MKNQKNMGGTTANRNLNDLKEAKQQRGVSNGGGQRSDQTSNRDSMHTKKKH